MTNREHILKVIAGLNDAELYDVYEGLPPEVLNRTPIRSACDLCPRREEDDCYADYSECDKHISAWMAAEAEPKGTVRR